MKTIRIIMLIVLFGTSALVAQVPSDSTTINSTISSDTVENTNKSKVKVSVLPYPFYSNLFKFGVGGFVGVSGLLSENSLIKAGGFISTNKSILGYVQIEEFQVPGLERLFIRPDLFFGKLGSVSNYSDLPLPRTKTFSTPAGVNNSDKDNYFDVEGKYQWYECTFGYLLPIGYGRDNKVAHPILEDGILVGGATGGYSLNPFKSGRTFLQSRISYRSLEMSLSNTTTTQVASGIEFMLNVENVDYVWNPTRGYTAKFSYFTDWKDLGGTSTFDVLKADIACYFPLSDEKSKTPSVLAFDFKTAHTLNWDEYDLVDFNGKQVKSYHRPPNFIGAFLGGPKTMRGYMEFRYFDRSSIYYCSEYRQKLPWNPFNYWSFTRAIGVNWIELAFFGELGRVAPNWNFADFHKDMKWDVGTGIRLFMNGLLLRLDVAYGKEGALFQMYYDYSF